ncbi:hypothetical protein [Herbaspirillum frisingense]|jgi:hypothetical protein|uniref:XRE family transcriptional regulator n=1 Tax=Herbaspirillum frisingense TaxID=92645 RepID=A0ABU1PF38_9BURK|nr:hypothetical protein [Herbaspirillum frisingense]MDR6584335.1 hypothetical protein [Herbaspirillum frisingense]
MKTIDDISSFLRYELSLKTYNHSGLDAELGLVEGTFVRILDGAGDYTVMELMAVLKKLGFELEIFDQEVLRHMREGPAGPVQESPVKTKVQIAVERIRTHSNSTTAAGISSGDAESTKQQVSLSDLTSTPPRTEEEIRRAIAEGRIAELKPDQA